MLEVAGSQPRTRVEWQWLRQRLGTGIALGPLVYDGACRREYRKSRKPPTSHSIVRLVAAVLVVLMLVAAAAVVVAGIVVAVAHDVVAVVVGLAHHACADAARKFTLVPGIYPRGGVAQPLTQHSAAGIHAPSLCAGLETVVFAP